MSDYTPTTDVVRFAYAADRGGSIDTGAEAAFDRWLESVQREAAAAALEEFAHDVQRDLTIPFEDRKLAWSNRLRTRATTTRNPRTPGEETTP